nr:E3 ubiquitin-protein ligase NEURL1-like [Oncorhynchus nerka]
MGGQITRNALYDSLGGPFPSTTHRCHHKPKRCLPIQQCGVVGGGQRRGLAISPLLFHPNTKGSQIAMDLAQRTVKRQASFCNAITFSNRPVALYEQVRIKITKKQCCWSGALRLGFTAKDPSRINPDSLPKYACPDLVSQSGFWAKALPEEFANEGNVIAFWVDKKGRVFYRINESNPMLFFSGVRTGEPLWALIDVYGLTRGVQLLESEMVPPDFLRPRSFTTVRSSSLRREADESRLSVSLCDLNLQEVNGSGPAHPHNPRPSPPVTISFLSVCSLAPGSTHLGDQPARAPSIPSSPSSSPHTPSALALALGSGSSDPVLNGGLGGPSSAAYCGGSAGGTTPSSPVSLPKSPTFPSGSGRGPGWPTGDECSICYENHVDTVIYACGHMCLCYTCGVKLKKMSNACCPICRRQIKDIIKTYRST